MSYISGLGGATSAYPTDQPVDQQERYGAARTATGPDGRSVVPDLYPRRPLGQRLTDHLAALAIFPFALVAVYAVTRQDRQAVTR